ncbi:unnamed protein product [Coffea canephora]|uniref:H(+)-transporting two-sector ATPase n=1 Tax=Coffea canephora TaxID=49390 RepID=A0A068VIU4_COFCA|nr:unnamed protein product [Coffea canephora]
MLQLDPFTYFTQFFWSCLFLLTFYIAIICQMDHNRGNSFSFPSSSSLPNPNERPKDEKSKRYLYNGFFHSLIRQLQMEAEDFLSKRIHYNRWAAALHEIMPKEGTDWQRLNCLLSELRREGKENRFFQVLLEEVLRRGG